MSDCCQSGFLEAAADAMSRLVWRHRGVQRHLVIAITMRLSEYADPVMASANSGVPGSRGDLPVAVQ